MFAPRNTSTISPTTAGEFIGVAISSLVGIPTNAYIIFCLFQRARKFLLKQYQTCIFVRALADLIRSSCSTLNLINKYFELFSKAEKWWSSLLHDICGTLSYILDFALIIFRNTSISKKTTWSDRLCLAIITTVQVGSLTAQKLDIHPATKVLMEILCITVNCYLLAHYSIKYRRMNLKMFTSMYSHFAKSTNNKIVAMLFVQAWYQGIATVLGCIRFAIAFIIERKVTPNRVNSVFWEISYQLTIFLRSIVPSIHGILTIWAFKYMLTPE